MTIPIDTTGRLGVALARLSSTHPLHAAIIDTWDIVEEGSSANGTMAVSVGENNRIRLTFDPAFVQRITPDEAASVLQHELHHVLFGHLTSRPENHPNLKAWRLAEEMTTNEFVVGPLPGRPILLKDFPGFPTGESTRERYRRLASSGRRPTGGAAKPDTSGQESPRCVAGDVAAPPQLVEQIVAADVAVAAARLSPTDASTAIQALARSLPSHGPASGLRARLLSLCGTGSGNVDWPQVLRRITASLSELRPSLRRPARRFPRLVGIVPGRGRVPGRPSILAVLDTSGSMWDQETFAAIKSAVEALSPLASVLIVECDTVIRRTYRFTGSLVDVSGGGGTSFIEPLADDFLKAHRVDAVFYFTDGFGEAPAQRPRIPVVWCLVGEAAKSPAPWGRVLRIPG